MASVEVRQPKVSRGRPLSWAATKARCSAGTRTGWCLGEVPAQQPVGRSYVCQERHAPHFASTLDESRRTSGRPDRDPAFGRWCDRPPSVGWDQPVTPTSSSSIRPLSFLGARGVLPDVLLGDLFARCHRQPLTHPRSPLQRPNPDSRFASTSPVRHAPHFASTLGESHRLVPAKPDDVALRGWEHIPVARGLAVLHRLHHDHRREGRTT